MPTWKVNRWVLRTLNVTTILLLAGLVVAAWLREKRIEIYDIPVAIYDTGNLVDYFHTYKRK